MRLSLLTQLVIAIVVVVFFTLGAVGWYSWIQIGGAVRQLSESSVSRTGPLVRSSVESFLERARMQAEANATEFGSGPAKSEFPRLARDLLGEFRQSRDFEFISFSIAETGDYMHLQRVSGPAGSWSYKWQTSLRQNNGSYEMREYDWTGTDFRLVTVTPKWDYDPRTRPYFQSAVESRSTVWTPIYALRNRFRPGSKQWGVTCASPVVRSGKVVAVATVDLSLESLTKYLETIRIGEAGFVFLGQTVKDEIQLLGCRDAGDRLVVATNPGSDPTLITLGELPITTSSEIRPLLQKFEREPTNGSKIFPGNAFEGIEGPFYAGYGELGPTMPKWTVFAVAGEKDFVGEVGQIRRGLGSFALAAVVLAIGLSYLIARRVSMPLRAIAEEMEGIRSLDLADRPNPTSNVREVAMLNASLDRMKPTLRSMVKLIPDEYARYLIEHGEEVHAGGHRQRLTIYFADLVGFTSFAERQSPEHVFSVLDDYLTLMGEAVVGSGGTIDKFTGDGLMAFWGAPTAVEGMETRACEAALACQARLSEGHEATGVPFNATYGIATGDVLVGNIGTPSRLNYTVIGDAANLAARLQGLNKVFGTRILTDGITAREASKTMLVRPVSWTVVQGRIDPFLAYEIVAPLASATSEQVRLAKGSKRLLGRLRKEAAADVLKEIDALIEQFPEDRPLRILRERMSANEALSPFDPGVK